ncbi:hypothetical protein IVB18_50080 (plasmid) [Bradyrhizobium sp. 186]|uniref:hypothetical protein n=1 Tax=Bradyrhizobium sp. 186 TaxID=2782654 RepID=UPI002000625A|nr:hypothetical protein [Bradyrhizobium sp. 186]UPK40783.1 hypothetical protein IVB18_50080 [Bradyrhizobium sp. 186]
MRTSKIAVDREARAQTTVKQLLRKAGKRSLHGQVFTAVPHGRETDANREFAPDRDSGAIVWFLIALPIFMVAHALCVKIGAI